MGFNYFTIILSTYWGLVFGYFIAMCTIEKWFNKVGDFTLTQKWDRLPEWYKKAKCKGVMFLFIGLIITLIEFVYLLMR